MMEQREPYEPRYEFCERCNAVTEQCLHWNHQGVSRCMDCGGGVGDSVDGYCLTCIDLVYREKREKALGHKIVYAGEMPTEDE